MLEIARFPEQIGAGRAEIRNQTRQRSFYARLELTESELAVLLSGGQLRYLKEQLRRGGERLISG